MATIMRVFPGKRQSLVNRDARGQPYSIYLVAPLALTPVSITRVDSSLKSPHLGSRD